MTKTNVDIIKDLYKGGLFSKDISISEISNILSKEGFPSLSKDSRAISVILLRLVRADFLSREKIKGEWKYRDNKQVRNGKKTESNKIHSELYDFHPKIKEVSNSQFKNKDYKGAIQNALVEVINQVKIRTGYPKNKEGKDLDGDDLMNRIFGCDNQTPQIKFNELQTSLDKAEQRGLMNLYKGIVGIRDKKAHLNFIQNDPIKAIEYLSLASLLIRLLDENVSQ